MTLGTIFKDVGRMFRLGDDYKGNLISHLGVDSEVSCAHYLDDVGSLLAYQDFNRYDKGPVRVVTDNALPGLDKLLTIDEVEFKQKSKWNRIAGELITLAMLDDLDKRNVWHTPIQRTLTILQATGIPLFQGPSLIYDNGISKRTKLLK